MSGHNKVVCVVAEKTSQRKLMDRGSGPAELVGWRGAYCLEKNHYAKYIRGHRSQWK